MGGGRCWGGTGGAQWSQCRARGAGSCAVATLGMGTALLSPICDTRWGQGPHAPRCQAGPHHAASAPLRALAFIWGGGG